MDRPLLHHERRVGFLMHTKKTLVLAHYYTTPEVQQMADYVGDSLDLAIKAVEEKPDRIVFAGVRFMAETVKLMLPNTEVILPHANSTCSLVTQTDVNRLRRWANWRSDETTTHVMYINSSVEMKALADIIVTSRNVSDIVEAEYAKGNNVIFSPDRNMGAYLNYTNGYNMNVWTAVCEVHDQFKQEEIDKAMRKWTDGPKFLLAHPESPLPVLKRADMVGSTSKMLQWVKDYPHSTATIFVATEEGLLHNMRTARPELDIQQAPTYSGCQCNQCPFMKMNTPDLVQAAVEGHAGVKIDYLSEDLMDRARKPVERMLAFSS